MRANRSAAESPIVLAYSGGLDTSFLVPWLAENSGRPVITVTVDTGGIDAATASTLADRARALGCSRASSGRCARRLLRAGAAIPDHGQCAARPALSAVRRRRARHAGADHGAHGARARHEQDRAWLHCRRQRSGALRSRAAHAWRRIWRCWRRYAIGPSAVRTSSTTCRRAVCRCRRSALHIPSIAASGA